MEFFAISYNILEIYPKNSNQSTCDNINENSHWIQISTYILENNPKLVEHDLTIFNSIIDDLYIKYDKDIRTNILKKSNCQILKDFDNCFEISSEFDKSICINQIQILLKKYSEINDLKEMFAILINLWTIKNYIRNYINDSDNMNIIKFNLYN